MHEAVLGLHQTEHVAGKSDRSDHLQGIERELLEELTIALGIGAQTCGARSTGASGLKWRAHRSGGINKSLIGLHLRQRLHAAARLLLRVFDEAREVVIGARAG